MQEAFAKYVDVNSVAESLAAPKAARLTPKAFMHSITQKCQANPQHIVLPEVVQSTVNQPSVGSNDKQVARHSHGFVPKNKPTLKITAVHRVIRIRTLGWWRTN